MRVDRDSPIEVCESAGPLALSVSQNTTIVMRLGVFRIKGDRLVEVGDCAGKCARGLAGQAAVIIRGGVALVDLEGLIEVGDGAGQVALQMPGRPAIEKHDGGRTWQAQVEGTIERADRASYVATSQQSITAGIEVVRGPGALHGLCPLRDHGLWLRLMWAKKQRVTAKNRKIIPASAPRF
jgi:hypothetical protein